jgi:ElaB/YqjD/DUF883 family membrane-anchored ribosome-binding protein
MAKAQARRAAGGRSRSANGNGSHHLYNDILTLAGSLVRNRKDSSADALGSMADATREYATKIEMPNVSTYVSSAADQLDYLSDYVMRSDLETMVQDAGTFARRHPMATLGMAAVAGFGLTRMIGLNGDSGSRSQTRGNSNASRQSSRRSRPSKRSSASRRGSARNRVDEAASTNG